VRVLIDPEVELYPEVTLLFDDEIAFPDVPAGCSKANCGIDVPDEVASRWQAARDAWKAVQQEARQLARPGEDQS
jgi:hypothetical protein